MQKKSVIYSLLIASKFVFGPAEQAAKDRFIFQSLLGDDLLFKTKTQIGLKVFCFIKYDEKKYA